MITTFIFRLLMSLLRNTDPNQENGETKPKSVKKDVNVSEMFQKIGAKLGWFEFKDLDSALKTVCYVFNKVITCGDIHFS